MIELEGRDLVVIEVGHSDTDDTTCLHVLSVGLVVAGDVAYNDVHLSLAESNAHTRHEWIAALDTIEALQPRSVTAGHKRPGNDDDPRIIEATRHYIRAFDRVADYSIILPACPSPLPPPYLFALDSPGVLSLPAKAQSHR